MNAAFREGLITPYTFMSQTKMTIFFGTVRSMKLKKQTIMLRSVSQMLKKLRIVVNRISKVRQTTSNCIKKILDEATRIVNMFLIS